MQGREWILCAGMIILAVQGAAFALIREVGPGKPYASINDAYVSAVAGDTILVYPLAADAPYEQVRVYATKARIAIIGAATAGRRVKLSGNGFVYSGVGSTPRAMFQFNLGTDDCLVEGFEISGCQNASYNGAGVRINQANRVTIRNCEIHNNDMGLMSNGSASSSTAADQLIEHCVVHNNGNMSDPGYNHNFYMGGTSVVIRGCNVYAATTGHNIKSRAHITIVEGCFVHDSPNRELDLVDDAANTTLAGSHALVSGSVIKKMDNCTGNRGTVHFGQDGGNGHNGTLYIVHSTILSQYVTAVTTVSAAGAGVQYYNSIIIDPARALSTGQALVALTNGASLSNSGGSNIWVSRAFTPGAGVSIANMTTGAAGVYPTFVAAAEGNYRLTEAFAGIVDAAAAVSSLAIPDSLRVRPVLQFSLSHGWETREFSLVGDAGAFEWLTVQNAFSRSASRPRTRVHAEGGSVYDLSGRKGELHSTGAFHRSMFDGQRVLVRP